MSTTKQEVDHVHEAHIQETKQEADIEWVKWHLCPSERHLCPRFEALETGQTEAEVMEATFKKQMEHKKNRVQRYHECLEKNSQKWKAKASKWGRETNPWTTRTGANLLRRTKKKLLRSNLEEMFPKGKAPAMAAKDVKAQNAWSSCSPQLLIMGVPCCWLTQS